MSKKARELTGEEKRLWRRVAAGVKARKPLADDEPEKESALLVRLAKAPVMSAPAKQKPSLKPAVPPANRGAEKKVRRGAVEIEGSLDLHGYTQDAALAALSAFLHRRQKSGARSVLVITGAGRGGEGVLKKRFPDWLSAAGIKPIVSGFAQAHRAHGGMGAFYVFLKRK